MSGHEKTSTADISGILAKVTEIDDGASSGLAGTADSISYRIAEVERHFHSYERWIEKAAVPNAEIHVADRMGSGIGAFQVDAGNDAWGSWVQVLGSSDTPVGVGNVKFDFHKIQIPATERNATYFIQIGFGASGADALTAGAIIDLVFTASATIRSAPVVVQGRRNAVSTKVWVRCKCPGQNTATLDFYMGLHEYEG